MTEPIKQAELIQVEVRDLTPKLIMLALASKACIPTGPAPSSRNVLMFWAPREEFAQLMVTTKRIEICAEWTKCQALQTLLAAVGAEVPAAAREAFREIEEHVEGDPELRRLILKGFGGLPQGAAAVAKDGGTSNGR